MKILNSEDKLNISRLLEVLGASTVVDTPDDEVSRLMRIGAPHLIARTGFRGK